MEPWLIGLLVVLAAILLYFLLGVISYLLLKKQKKICDEELAKLVDEERNRGEKVLEILKVNREDKKFGKIVSPYVEELKNIRDNQEIFISYNKKATKYNILYSMSFTRFVLLFKKDKGTNYSIY